MPRPVCEKVIAGLIVPTAGKGQFFFFFLFYLFLNKICQDLRRNPLCKSSLLSTQTFVMLGAHVHFVLNADSVTIDPRVEFQKKARLCVVRLLLSEQSAKTLFI